MFFFITAPYNRITKLTQESEEFTYEKITQYLFMYDTLLLGSHKCSPVFLHDDETTYFSLRTKSL